MIVKNVLKKILENSDRSSIFWLHVIDVTLQFMATES